MIELFKDKDLLMKLFKSCKEYPNKERYHALYIRSLGHSRKFVAELFCRDENTLHKWEEKWLNERNVKNQPKEGRPNEVDEKLEEKKVRLVEENDPKKYGMNCSFWDCIELQKYFLINGTTISRETIS